MNNLIFHHIQCAGIPHGIEKKDCPVFVKARSEPGKPIPKDMELCTWCNSKLLPVQELPRKREYECGSLLTCNLDDSWTWTGVCCDEYDFVED